jgi:hypothetical protein
VNSAILWISALTSRCRKVSFNGILSIFYFWVDFGPKQVLYPIDMVTSWGVCVAIAFPFSIFHDFWYCTDLYRDFWYGTHLIVMCENYWNFIFPPTGWSSISRCVVLRRIRPQILFCTYFVFTGRCSIRFKCVHFVRFRPKTVSSMRLRCRQFCALLVLPTASLAHEVSCSLFSFSFSSSSAYFAFR